MALVPKEGGSISYQVPASTSTNYPVWAVTVKSIMDAYGLWATVEPRGLGEEPDLKKSKQALAFFVSSDTRRNGFANGELHRPEANVGWSQNTILGCGSGENGSACNIEKGA